MKFSHIITSNRKRFTALGAIKITWTHTAVYINMIMFLFVCATFYHTTGVKWFKHYLHWDPGFPLFMAGLSVCVLTFMALFIFRYDVPSSLGWHYDQQCSYGKVYRNDINSILSEIRELKAQLAEYQSIKNDDNGHDPEHKLIEVAKQ